MEGKKNKRREENERKREENKRGEKRKISFLHPKRKKPRIKLCDG